jgi:hypothetical protein
MATDKNFHVEFLLGRRQQLACFIFRGNNTIPLGAGVAYCRADDPFDVTTGEKISLKRALADSGMSKGERQKAWEEYLEWKGISQTPKDADYHIKLAKAIYKAFDLNSPKEVLGDFFK